jgi:hypothetical protein
VLLIGDFIFQIAVLKSKGKKYFPANAFGAIAGVWVDPVPSGSVQRSWSKSGERRPDQCITQCARAYANVGNSSITRPFCLCMLLR